MDYGILPTGFRRKRLDEILATKDEGVRGIFGPDINLTPQSPDGQINGLMSLSDDQLWQIAEYAYNATDPQKAQGPALSSVVKLNYIERLEDKASVVTLSCTGTPGVTIAGGQLVRVPDTATRVRTRTEFTFSAGGAASVVADCTVPGEVIIAPGQLTVIDTPAAGWASVTNPAAATPGRLRETDGELRLRQQRSPGTNSQNMKDSLIGLVGNVPGVTYVDVLVNYGDNVDANGLGGHSFEVIVEGGEPDELAQVIWRVWPFGIGNEGTSSGTAIDASGHPQTVKFTRPQEVLIYVVTDFHKYAEYPDDGDALTKQAVVDYSEGDLIQGRGFGVGKQVVYSELYTPLNTVGFHDIEALKIGTAPAPTGTDNIPITVRQRSKFLVSNIQINSV